MYLTIKSLCGILLITFLVLVLPSHRYPAHLQALRHIVIKNRKERKVIEDYIRDCQSQTDKNKYGQHFEGDTGIVIIGVRKPDELGQISWNIFIRLNYNSNKYAPPLGTPVGWSNVSNKIVLWYDNAEKNKPTEGELLYMEKIAYPHLKKVSISPVKSQYQLDLRPGHSVLNRDGTLILYNVAKDISTGGVYSTVIFKKDGSVSLLKAL